MTWAKLVRMAILDVALRLQAALSDEGVAKAIAGARAFLAEVIEVQKTELA